MTIDRDLAFYKAEATTSDIDFCDSLAVTVNTALKSNVIPPQTIFSDVHICRELYSIDPTREIDFSLTNLGQRTVRNEALPKDLRQRVYDGAVILFEPYVRTPKTA